jgi:L-ascorbate metabolism protein UlaG (beta-lactamase superfamily)
VTRATDDHVELTYIGGPTVILDIAGYRIVTDPTFDPAGTEYPTPIYTLHKTQDPALTIAQVGALDVALVSHDHHFDNLDRAGRRLVEDVPSVITTRAGAERLGSRTIGLDAWNTYDLPARNGSTLRITATPARHGPAGGDRGPVVGFVVEAIGGTSPVIYLSGDTVLYDALDEVGRRVDPDVAILFMGAARVREVGPAHLTLTAAEGVHLAREVFTRALIVPVHFEGWAHFSESRPEIDAAFAAAGLADRLRWPTRDRSLRLSRQPRH